MSNANAAEWNRELAARVGGPIPYETLQSVFITNPSNSGDVALVTSVVRHIKARNPRCRVSFAVKRSNLPLLKMCPGVNEAIEIPTLRFEDMPGRRGYVAEHADRAEAVIYPLIWREDLDLLGRFNFLETIWLLSGVPDGMPPGPHPLWLTPPDDPQIAARVLGRCLSREYADELTHEAHRRFWWTLRKLLRQRHTRDIDWENIKILRRHAAFIRTLAAQTRSQDAARAFVIVSSEANALPPPPKGVFEEIIRFLRSQGRIVLHNVREPSHAIPGAIPLVCSYEEFLCLRQAGVPFVGWRSGLCDIAAAAPARMCVLTDCETTYRWYGFEAMNVAPNCVEFICDSPEALDMEKVATILNLPPADGERLMAGPRDESVPSP